MKTTLTKIKASEQKWYLIDAKDQILGKIATKASDRLRGKDKACFAPHMDCGDYVVIINAEKVKLTGSKLQKKEYYTHSGYLGHLKTETADKLLARKPEKLLKLAIYGMLPKNRLRRKFMDKLKIYAGEVHTHEAQNPINLAV
ncbi:MAG: 50S ribosomal protein L13 [Candidatus Gracilibacteria bacterium]|jgi:large subunit ribosomal protein L13